MKKHPTVSDLFVSEPATTGIYTLSLHDALPISSRRAAPWCEPKRRRASATSISAAISRRPPRSRLRSEEHTSELQSQSNLVCRLLLEKKKKNNKKIKKKRRIRTSTDDQYTYDRL